MDNLKAESKEQRLAFVCQATNDNYYALQRAFVDDKSNERLVAMALWGHFERHALKQYFLEKDIQAAKRCFYQCGYLDKLLIRKYDERILDYGINHISYALLSDSVELIQDYAELRHSSFERSVQAGTATSVYILQCLIKDDWSEFERAMAIMKTKTVPKFKMSLDAVFYQALAERN